MRCISNFVGICEAFQTTLPGDTAESIGGLSTRDLLHFRGPVNHAQKRVDLCCNYVFELPAALSSQDVLVAHWPARFGACPQSPEKSDRPFVECGPTPWLPRAVWVRARYMRTSDVPHMGDSQCLTSLTAGGYEVH